MKNTISPEILMMRSIGGMIVPLTIKSALELDLFRVIDSGVTNAQSLATTLQLNPSALQRLLRALVVMGLLTETTESSGNYSLTDTGKTLLPGFAPVSMAALANYLLDDSTLIPMMKLSESVRTGKPALKQDAESGWYHDYPERALLMDKAMAVYSSLSLPALLSCYDFSAFRVLMDIGGGVGQMLTNILTANPALNGIVFDIPETVKRASSHIQSQGLENRCQIIAGDMFTSIPAGADLYLLSKVLNNWDDRHALELLKNIRVAMPDKAKLIIVENLASTASPSMEEVFRDLMFLSCSNGGKVRSLAEFRELITDSGLECLQVIATPASFSIIECQGVAG